MDRGFDIPWVGGSKYHGKGGRYTTGRGFNIPWIGDQNTIGRGFDMPYVEEQKYHE